MGAHLICTEKRNRWEMNHDGNPAVDIGSMDSRRIAVGASRLNVKPRECE